MQWFQLHTSPTLSIGQNLLSHMIHVLSRVVAGTLLTSKVTCIFCRNQFWRTGEKGEDTQLPRRDLLPCLPMLILKKKRNTTYNKQNSWNQLKRYFRDYSLDPSNRYNHHLNTRVGTILTNTMNFHKETCKERRLAVNCSIRLIFINFHKTLSIISCWSFIVQPYSMLIIYRWTFFSLSLISDQDFNSKNLKPCNQIITQIPEKLAKGKLLKIMRSTFKSKPWGKSEQWCEGLRKGGRLSNVALSFLRVWSWE